MSSQLPQSPALNTIEHLWEVAIKIFPEYFQHPSEGLGTNKEHKVKWPLSCTSDAHLETSVVSIKDEKQSWVV